MPERLKSVLRSLTSLLPSALKALVFAFLLSAGQYSAWIKAAAIFWALGIFIFSKSPLARRRLLFSGLLAVGLSLLLEDQGGAVLGGLLLFLLITAEEMAVTRYDLAYYAAHSLLAFGFVFLFFSQRPFFSIPGDFLVFAAAFFLLLSELLRLAAQDNNLAALPQHRALIAAAFTLAGIEILWTISFLPFPPFYASIGALFILLTIEDAFFRSLRGFLSRPVILRNLTAVIFILLAIAGVTAWTP